MFPIASAALEKHAGVRFNPAKSAILLAAGHADLDPVDVPEGVQIKRDGTVVVGAAVGTDQFVHDHLMAVVRQATRKLEALDLLDPQSALLLLSGCLALALGYHLQVTPPRLALAAAQAWDAAVDATRLRIASDPALGRAPQVGAALQDLADRKARLPLKCGGLGQTSAVLLSPIAFYATYSQHAFLEQGTRTRLLQRELAFAAGELRTLLPPAGLELVVPIGDLGADKPPRKLQRDLTRAAHALALQRLKDSARDARDTRVLAHTTDAFLPFLAAPTSAALVVEPHHFTAGLRSYLLLPQLLRLSTPPVLVDPLVSPGAADYSYEADACPHCPGRVCDRHLAHAHVASPRKKKSRQA
jgi:hypothetical protein